jgi:hypothetical protein
MRNRAAEDCQRLLDPTGVYASLRVSGKADRRTGARQGNSQNSQNVPEIPLVGEMSTQTGETTVNDRDVGISRPVLGST